MSLTHRLRQMQAAQPAATVETEDLSQMSREDLALELIPFGQKHQGETFLTAWQDQEWVSFMVSRYQTSKKASSSSFHSVRRTAGGTLRAGTDSPPGQSAGTHALAPQRKAKAKALPKMMSQPAHQVPVDLVSELEGEEEWEPMITTYNADSETVQAMQQRLLNMEEALMRVMRHLKDQSAQQTQD